MLALRGRQSVFAQGDVKVAQITPPPAPVAARGGGMIGSLAVSAKPKPPNCNKNPPLPHAGEGAGGEGKERRTLTVPYFGITGSLRLHFSAIY